MIRFAAILTCCALASCSSASAVKAQAVELGAEATLAPEAMTSVKGAQMTVRFVAVTEDSRCPRDVTCIWAGEVKVLFEIQVSQAASQVEILEGGSAVSGGYRVTLVRVEPQRTSTARTAPQDYRATLKIDKAG